MATQFIGALYGTLSLKTSAYDKSMKAAAITAKQFSRTIFGIGAALIGYAAGRGVGRVVKANLALAQSLDVTSRKLGVPVEGLQRLRAAAEEFSKIEASAFDTALQRMTRRLAEAAHGTGEAQKALKALKLDAKELVQLTPDEAFLRIADAMQNIGTQGDRVALSFKLFDTEGVALVNTLSQGRARINDLADTYAKLGLIFDEFAIKSATATDLSLKKLSKSAASVGTILSFQLAVPLTAVSNKFIEAAADSQRFGLAGAASAGGVSQAFILAANSISKAQLVLLKGTLSIEKLQAKALKFYSENPNFLPKEVNIDAIRERLAVSDLYTQALEEELGDFKMMGDELAAEIARINEYLLKQIEVGAGPRGTFDPTLFESADTAAQELAKTADSLGMTFSSAFEDAIVGGNDLRDVLKGLADDILRIAIRKSITEPLAGGIASIFTGMFGGARASGGPVFSDRAYVVGEEGPEWFVPGRSGVVLPNGYGAGQSSGGGTSVTINQNFAVGVTDTVRAEMVAMMPTFKAVAVGAVREARAQRKLK